MMDIVGSRTDFSSLLETANKIGKRFSKRYEVHLDEAQAEAQCQLVFYFYSNLFKEKGFSEAIFYGWIRYRLFDYFNQRPDRSHRSHLTNHSVVACVTQPEVVEWLGGFLGCDKQAFEVIKLLQHGLSFDDIKLIPDINKLHTDRVRRLLKIYLRRILGEPDEIRNELEDQGLIDCGNSVSVERPI